MTRYSTKTSISATWLLALTIALWAAAGRTSVLGWLALAFIGIMPILVLMWLSQEPAKTTAQIIRDVDAGRAQ